MHTNGVVCKRPGWNENLRILREKADCKQSSLTEKDTRFGVALDKGTIRQGRSCLFICFLITIMKKERLISCCFFFRRYSDRLQASHIYDFK